MLMDGPLYKYGRVSNECGGADHYIPEEGWVLGVDPIK